METKQSELKRFLRENRTVILANDKARRLNRELRRALRNEREDAGVPYAMGGPALDYAAMLTGIRRAIGG